MNLPREYVVTQDLKSKQKLASRVAFYTRDLIFMLCFLGVIRFYESLVSSRLRVIYWIISIGVSIILIIPSIYNPKRKMYETLMLYLKKDYSIYYPVHVKKEIMEKKDMNKKKKTTDDMLLGIHYDADYDCFYLRSIKTYMNVVQIITKDIINASEDDIEYDISKLLKFNQLEFEDYKIYSMNFPCNTSQQQEFIKRKIERTTNKQYLKYLQNSLYELEWVQEKKSKREFYMMIFSDTAEGIKKMEADMKTALQSRDKMIGDITYDKRKTILFRICNPASMLTGGN